MSFEIIKYNQYGLDTKATYSTCPKCSHTRKKENQKQKCMMLDWERGLGTCSHCNVIIQLHEQKWKSEEEKEYFKPKIKHNRDVYNDFLLKYMVEVRKINLSTLKRFKITSCKEWFPQTGKEEDAICFNYFRGEELINTKFRSPDKHFKLVKDAEKIFYNFNALSNYKEIIIVEGEIDALSFFEAGFDNVISVPNGFTKNKINTSYLDSCIDLFDNIDEVYLAFDNDEAGQNGEKEFLRRLGADKCKKVDLKDCKDANEYLIKYGSQALNKTIHEADYYPIENVLTINDFRSELENFYENGVQKGLTIGLDNFDENFSTYTSQYIVFTGVPSSGKSDFCDTFCIGLNLRYGFKVAYASPENKPDFLHSDKLIRKIYGSKIKNKEHYESDDVQNVVNYVSDNFYHLHFNRFTLEEVLKKGAELVKRKGIKVLVIDPFNKVKSTTANKYNINDYTNDYLNQIDDFCKKYDVLVCLVAHPTKMEKEDNGNFKKPSMYNIKGGGEFYDMAYHGLLVHRDYVDNKVEVQVLKIKFNHLGNNMSSTHFKFNLENNRYEPIYNNGTPAEKFSFSNKNLLTNIGIEVSNTDIINNTTLTPNNEFEFEINNTDEVPF